MNIPHPETPGPTMPKAEAPNRSTQRTDRFTTPLIETYFDAVTHDFCAECRDFGGLISWGATAQEACDKVQEDWLRHKRYHGEQWFQSQQPDQQPDQQPFQNEQCRAAQEQQIVPHLRRTNTEQGDFYECTN